MSNPVGTVTRLAWQARRGASPKDKWLAFLLGSIVSIGSRKKKLRARFIRLLDHHDREEQLNLRLYSNGQLMTVSIRRGNESDYHILGRLVRGDYPVPKFQPKTIIDGGANIGTFSIHAKSFFPEAKLICYEPDHENCSLLRFNLDQNGIDGDLHQLGLWSSSGIAYYRARSSRTGFIENQPGGPPVGVTLPEIDLDTWLKLDIEGGEHEVLPALFRAQRFPRLITVEIHDFETRGGALLTLLKEHGYDISGNIPPNVNCIRISALLRRIQQLASGTG